MFPPTFNLRILLPHSPPSRIRPPQIYSPNLTHLPVPYFRHIYPHHHRRLDFSIFTICSSASTDTDEHLFEPSISIPPVDAEKPYFLCN
ncbi:hypothetical protein L1987_20574 [Smallanthus sonchifolius]|uniref:Uncharacterized protein n=1 Tax=Smallanthus sonchifolius TaxID=185202 RepID=A0ACB9ISE8_9ASTR|nr:hypothetical protein L1987_20574 [Smallanthus sonchifolius]